MRHNDPVNANNMHGGGYVIGVDFGTLSGRALVVRVADGGELGTAVHEYRHGVMDTVLASPAARCRRTGRCRIPRITGTCCGMPCRPRSPTRASTPRR
jgi:hypothetical protein